jgi:4Fe-4S binding domain
MRKAADVPGAKIDLMRLPLIKSALRSRWPQLLLRMAALGGFLFTILAGLLGTPVGSRNFAIVFVWIAWWALLMLLAVPFLGRGWCSICPIPMPGEWLQQGALLKPQGGGLGSGKRWPKRLRNIWLQNSAFAMVALFSTIVLTQPGVSAVVLCAFLLVATGTSLVFERRAFCRYLCPVSGFIGLYAQAAPIELRVKDSALCAGHTDKTCYTGSADGYGCPWQVFPGGLVKNSTCGLCMECLRTCPYDNIALNLRGPGADLVRPRGRKLDEAFKAFIMLGSAMVYPAVMLGPWGWLKTSASQIGSLGWLAYALGLLAFVLALLPGAFALAVMAGQRLAGWRGKPSRQQLRSDFTQLAYALVPLGLAAWIAFSISFIFANLSYIWPVLSDPFGWGWNLFGTGSAGWRPYLTQVVPALQGAVLLGGLAWAAGLATRICGQIQASGNNPGRAASEGAARRALPVVLFCLAVTAGLMGLLLA